MKDNKNRVTKRGWNVADGSHCHASSFSTHMTRSSVPPGKPTVTVQNARSADATG